MQNKQLCLSEKFYIGFALLSLIAILSFRILYSSAFARSWDAVDFALGVQSYNLLDMQPHFPGYPYFILGGMLVNLWVEDPARSLALWNSLFSLSSLLPMWFIYRRYLTISKALIAVAFSQSIPFLTIIIASPMSEGTAFTILWWYIWGLMVALERGRYRYDLLPLALFSLLMGVRLSYLPFCVGILLLWYKRLREKGLGHVLEQAGIAFLFQFLWVYPLILSVGGIDSFQFIATKFVEGHFTGWGGSIATEQAPFITRVWTFIWTNILWTGLSVHSVLILILYGVLVLSLFRGPSSVLYEKLWWSLGTAYTFWAFFAQNVDKPRHILPTVVILVILLLVHLLKGGGKRKIGVVSLLLLMNTGIGGYYVHKQATELPATYQLANYVEQQSEPLKIYTWEEERVLQYVGVSKSFQKIQTYALFKEDASNQLKQGKTVYVTDRVVQGFIQQGMDTTDFTAVKKFTSDPLFDPVYSDITLYKWVTSSSP
ncbi:MULTISPECIES: nucleoporin-interacting protein [Pontibacillus]|uniref:Nucleoporin-interacting protein n=1 Tax=Pontibacillus chungwhensis TaxID=265426 RepID=A0ABY8UU03_9BACI|nr:MULTISPECIES: nucleoporin-interacting protein [Pontibacillus]MCD5323776.1 nucleoporin-interacting protein [Pontibacillus sp. HN14]WIF97140.1 nucleoporin-interacting protein [Pontibacillus chungwhensis]